MIRKSFLILSCVFALSGCATLAQIPASLATNLSSSTSGQVKTLAEAEQAATLLTNTVDIYVNSGNPNKATLQEIQQLSNGVHTALGVLQQANANNQSIAIASFNAALQAFNAYATTQGIPH